MISDDDDSDGKSEQEGVETTIAKQIFDEDDEGFVVGGGVVCDVVVV